MPSVSGVFQVVFSLDNGCSLVQTRRDKPGDKPGGDIKADQATTGHLLASLSDNDFGEFVSSIQKSELEHPSSWRVQLIAEGGASSCTQSAGPNCHGDNPDTVHYIDHTVDHCHQDPYCQYQLYTTTMGSEKTFDDLPDSLHLQIFSHLGVADLCRTAQVCSRWSRVASDEVMWQKRLERDSLQWSVINHSTHPDKYTGMEPPWTSKEIYLRCSPEVNEALMRNSSSFQYFTGILRSFWPKKSPRLVMFGPGLESETSQIARKIMEDRGDTFKRTGMFPGQFEGIGSGFTIRMSGVSYHLITLYTSTRKERETLSRDERLKRSRLLQQVKAPGGDREDREGAAVDPEAEGNNSESEFEVRKAVQDLCKTVDGFIYVVNTELKQDDAACEWRSELEAMINKRWVADHVPLVTLAASASAQTLRVPCVNVVRRLRLERLERPWQVHDCTVDDMSGVVEGIKWVVEQAQRPS